MAARSATVAAKPVRLLTVQQVAQLMGCSRDSVYDLISSGALTATDIAQPGKRARLRVAATVYDEFVAARQTAPVPTSGRDAIRARTPGGRGR